MSTGILLQRNFDYRFSTSLDEIRAVPSSNLIRGFTALFTGTENRVGDESFWLWNPSSNATDNGTDALKPSDLDTADPGRWLRIYANAGYSVYNQGAASAVDTTQSEVNQREIDVFDFLSAAEKADVLNGTGAVNVAASLQAAIDACNYGERSLRIRAGEYYTGTTPLSINGPIRIYGEGMGQAYGDSFGALCTTIRYVGTDAAIKINTGISKSTLGFVLQDLAISGYATGTATATGYYGIRLGSDTGTNLACQGEMRNVRVEGFSVAGLHNINAQGVAHYNCRTMFCADGILQEGGATSGGGNRSNSYWHCHFRYGTKRGAYLKEGGNTSFHACHFENNDYEAVVIERQASTGSYDFSNFAFYDCHVENNQESPAADGETYAAQIRIDTTLDTGAGGARVFISGGRWNPALSETNGSKLNRLWVVKHGSLFMNYARPNLFTYAQGAVELDDDNYLAVVRIVDNYAPYIGSPTSRYPVSGVGVVDFWTLPSAATISGLTGSSVSWEHINVRTGERYYGTNEDIYIVSTASAYVKAHGAFAVTHNGSANSFEVDASATAGNTRMLVWDVDNGQLERVSVGAADSGGVGYKVLRIPN